MRHPEFISGSHLRVVRFAAWDKRGALGALTRTKNEQNLWSKWNRRVMEIDF